MLRGEHPQIVGVLDHRPIDEQTVDTRGLLQCLTQPAARIEIELQSDSAKMQIEIEKCDPLRTFCGH